MVTAMSSLWYLDDSIVAVFPLLLDNFGKRDRRSYTDAWRTGYAQESVTVADMGGTTGSRIFFHSRSNFVCYDANGTFLWKIGNLHRTWTDAFSPMGNWYDLPDFAVEDVDNDGTKEVVVAGSAYDPTTNKASLFVHLLKADGSSFSSNWPRVFPNYIDLSKMQYIPKIHVADISGNADKEIIFYRKPLYYRGIPVADIRGGELHAVGLNAQDVWTMSFPPEQTHLPLDVADVDNDGKDEILLEPDRILEDNGTFKAGWATEANPGFRAKLVDLDLATPELEVLMYQAWWGTSYELTVLDHNGVEISGWPATITTNITYDYDDPKPWSPVVTVGQASAGGDPEVIVCDDSIRVLGSDGQPIASRPDINISGRCMGMRLVDLDGDNSLDTYIVLVQRAKVGVPADFRRGNFLEAYQLDGTRLAGGGRWPIVVDGENFRASGHYSGEIYWNGSVTVGDIDGDNSLEAIHLLRLVTEPPQTLPRNDTRIEVLDIQ